MKPALAQSKNLCSINDVIQIYFSLPDVTKIECSAKVLWINENTSLYPKGFGVKFSLMAKDVRAAFDKFINSYN
jgi:Tfp pilus assembly protein PilZ